MNRFLAVLAAIGMIAGALYVRGRIDDDDGGGGVSEADGGEVTLVCAPEVADACREVDERAVVEDAAATAERLLAGDPIPSAWVTAGPWPAIVDALRTGQTPLFPDGGETVASTRLTLVAPPGAPGTWDTVGRQVVAGDLRLAWRDPTTGVGLLQVGAFAVGRFGDTDFASNDFDSAFNAYLDGLVDESQVARNPLERRLQQGRSFADAVMSFQTEADPTLEAAAASRRGDLAPAYPEPVVAVEAVVATPGGGADDIGRELQELGWDEPAASGLPAPGVLAALWRELSR